MWDGSGRDARKGRCPRMRGKSRRRLGCRCGRYDNRGNRGRPEHRHRRGCRRRAPDGGNQWNHSRRSARLRFAVMQAASRARSLLRGESCASRTRGLGDYPPGPRITSATIVNPASPSGARIDSEWSCTATTGSSGCSTTIAIPLSLPAVTCNASGTGNSRQARKFPLNRHDQTLRRQKRLRNPDDTTVAGTLAGIAASGTGTAGSW